jgi:serine/threonine protein kinase
MVNRKEFIGELAMLAQLSHPNVVQFLGAVTKTQPLVMVTEYLPKGDLYAHMEKSGRLEAGTAVQFALDIARYSHCFLLSEVLRSNYDIIASTTSFESVEGELLFPM